MDLDSRDRFAALMAPLVARVRSGEIRVTAAAVPLMRRRFALEVGQSDGALRGARSRGGAALVPCRRRPAGRGADPRHRGRARSRQVAPHSRVRPPHGPRPLARASGERGNTAGALLLLGDVLARSGPDPHADALSFTGQALALAEELGQRPLEERCHRALRALLASRDPGAALRHETQAGKIAAEIGLAVPPPDGQTLSS